MKNVKLANRYAKSLFDFALEKQELETVYKDSKTVLEILQQNRELYTVLESPVIPHSKKSKIFLALFKDTLHPITLAFLRLLLLKKREPSLALILTEFEAYYYKFHNIKKVDLISARPMTEANLNKLKVILEQRTSSKIEIYPVVKPEVIGGFMVKIDDVIFDHTVLKDVVKLKREFSVNVYQTGF
ncbi:MAG: ATP synthase F1 subunit delta [Bacteroidales bacterium]|jgi:F-type H+-transporting ATPase subunit delta|nr:ATP synthase F1 subunit delta [Bacteroidales bacterium]